MKKITLKFTALLLGSALATSVLATENSSNSSSSDYELEKVLIFSNSSSSDYELEKINTFSNS